MQPFAVARPKLAGRRMLAGSQPLGSPAATSPPATRTLAGRACARFIRAFSSRPRLPSARSPSARKLSGYRQCHAQPIDGGTGDAARIARALSARIQPAGNVGRFRKVRLEIGLSNDAHRA